MSFCLVFLACLVCAKFSWHVAMTDLHFLCDLYGVVHLRRMAKFFDRSKFRQDSKDPQDGPVEMIEFLLLFRYEQKIVYSVNCFGRPAVLGPTLQGGFGDIHDLIVKYLRRLSQSFHSFKQLAH